MLGKRSVPDVGAADLHPADGSAVLEVIHVPSSLRYLQAAHVFLGPSEKFGTNNNRVHGWAGGNAFLRSECVRQLPQTGIIWIVFRDVSGPDLKDPAGAGTDRKQNFSAGGTVLRPPRTPMI